MSAPTRKPYAYHEEGGDAGAFRGEEGADGAFREGEGEGVAFPGEAGVGAVASHGTEEEASHPSRVAPVR